jgi:3-ketosteroid 9alpha-monooxygenase subunit A
MSRFPFSRYPNGWFQVAYSDELPSGGVLPLRYFGKELVLFRPEGGGAQLLDAFCPHLGAHLGHGGKVKGECVRCPFHAWEFNGKGECTTIPYAQKIPPKAKIQPWLVKEVNGMVMAYHHATGEPPSWEPVEAPEHSAEDWVRYERREWKIKTHNQEMAENSVDIAHFHHLHGTLEIPTTQAEIQGHLLHVLSNTLMRTPMGKTSGSVEVHAHGFGYTLTRFKGIVETLLISSATTIDEDYVHVRFGFYLKKLAHKDVTLTVGRAFVAEIERQLEQDIPIWENKVYVHPPLLSEVDGPIGLFRKWSRQFYSSAGA